jgi:prephenate dehydrogenase
MMGEASGSGGAPARGASANRRAAAAALPQRIAFVGFGLIGGSIAGALREAEFPGSIRAWSPNGHGPAAGKDLGLVDVACGSVEEALEGAGLVVLAGPPVPAIEVLDGIAGARRSGRLAADATVTDVASTKARIVARAAELELPFVGGHPMAGREVAGVEASTPDLFVDRPWVVVPAPSARDRDVVNTTALAWSTGARPLQMTAEAHDRAVAAISHLPLVVAAALVEAVAGGPDRSVAHSLAASGWASSTRLAKGDPEMGAGILATNAAEVADRLRAMRAALDGWLELLDAANGEPDPDVLRARLAAARDALPSDGE